MAVARLPCCYAPVDIVVDRPTRRSINDDVTSESIGLLLHKDRISNSEQPAVPAAYLDHDPVGLLGRHGPGIFAVGAAEPLVEEPAVGQEAHLRVRRAI